MIFNKVKYISILLCLVLFSCSGGKKKGTHRNKSVSAFYVAGKELSDDVYVCTGPYSKRYHCDRYCKGLENCSEDVEVLSVTEAEDLGRTPCHWCY